MKITSLPQPRRHSLFLPALFPVLAAVLVAHAATDTWVGNNSALFSGDNWTGGNNPPVSADSLVFGVAGTAGTALTADQAAAITYAGITFNAGASAYTIGGANGITLTGSLINNGTSLETLNFPIASTAVRTITTTAGGGDITLGAAYTGTGGGITKTGSGTLTLAGANTYTAATTVSAGTLTLSGSLINTSGNVAMQVGDVTGFPVFNMLAGSTLTLTAGNGASVLLANVAANQRGVINQSGGAITISGSLFIGNSTAGTSYYGCYNLSGGTFTQTGANRFRIGQSPGIGSVSMFNQSGGTVTTSLGMALNDTAGTTAGAGGWASVYVSGGTLSSTVGGMGLGIGGRKGTNIVTVAGTGSITMAAAGSVCLGGSVAGTSQAGDANRVAVLNLGTGTSGGTLQASNVWQNPTQTPLGYLGFNGGTLKARVASTAFMTGLTRATVYSGGGTVDNNGVGITIGQALLLPTGQGVTDITVSGATGYTGAPFVYISGGTPTTPATAVANVDGNGTVTSITVTCPGNGYASTPTVTLIGGGGTAGTLSATLGTLTSGGMTFTGAGTTTLTGANTYTGNTVVNSGSILALGTGGSLASPNIQVNAGGTFNVSGITYTLGASQTLLGGGAVSGLVTTASGAQIMPGTDGTADTLTFNTGLTMTAGSVFDYDLSASASTGNDKVVVAGTLALNSTVFNLKGPATLATSDYTLATATSVTGTPVVNWVAGSVPANIADFVVVNDGVQVKLHFTGAPTAAAVASPTTLTRNQATTISATVTPGTIGNVAGVTVDLTPIGGSAAAALVLSDVANVYTNTFVVAAGTTPGSKILTVSAANDSSPTPYVGTATVTLTINVGSATWDGGSGVDNNWSSNPNWTGDAGPGLVGDSVTFDGSTRLTPVMDANYSLTSLTFASTAGGFSVGGSGTLTLTSGGVVNNSANGQAINVPVVLSAAESLNAAAGDLTLGGNLDNGGFLVTVPGAANTAVSGNIVGTGGLTKSGNGTLTLSGINTYSGATTVAQGNVLVSGAVASTAAACAVGNSAGNKAVLTVANGSFGANYNSGQIYNSSLDVGNNATAAGVVQVTGAGAVFNVNRQLALGNPGYGAFSQSAGATVIGGFLAVGGTANGGVFNQSGGTVSLTNAPATIGYVGTAGLGLLNLSGTATFNATGASGNGVWIGELGTAVLNVAGSAALNIPNDGVILGKANTTLSKGTVNLLGGTITVKSVTKGTGTGVFNFNGGTLKANSANTSFLTGLSSAYVYAGGGTLDDGGFAITVAQPLLAPAGYGVSAIGVTAGGSGYVDTPLVTISGGSGSGATAIATVAGGVVTGITITCPGTGYLSGETLTAALAGGGGSGATLDVPVLAANNSGGLTKAGVGTLTLSGANTYTGNTTIGAGTLLVNGSVSSASVAVNGGTLGGSGTIGGAVTVASGGTLAPGTASLGTLTLNGTLSLGGNATFRVNKAGTTYTSDKVAGATAITAGGTLTVTASGDALTGGDTFTLFNATPGGTFAATNLPALSAGLNWWTVNNFASLFINHAPVVTTPIELGAQSGVLQTLQVVGGKYVTDADGDTLTISAVSYTSGNGATVTINGNNVEYTAAGGYTGADSFGFTVSDGHGGTATGVVNVVVSPVATPQAPTIVVGAGSTTVSFWGVPGVSYTIQRAPAVTGPWTDLGPATANAANVQPVGRIHFTDPAPLGGSGYYRLKP